MPYGIKNKSKAWEDNTKTGQKVDSRIEACVNKLMADPKFTPQGGEDKKTAAIKVCKSSINKSNEFKRQLL